MKVLKVISIVPLRVGEAVAKFITRAQIFFGCIRRNMNERYATTNAANDERGDVPGWVLVVLMTTGLVTAIWTIAAPRLSAILRNSLDSMNGIR